MQDLQRKELKVPAAPLAEDLTIDPMRMELASKARNFLGYDLLGTSLYQKGSARMAERDQIVDLASIFNDLGIQPFDAEQVAAYKVERVKEMNKASMKDLPFSDRFYVRTEPWMGEPLIGVPVLVSAVVGTIVTILTAVDLIPPTHFHPITTTVGLLGMALWYPFINFVRSDNAGVIRNQWGWTTYSLEHLSSRGIEIPEFALNTAVNIKERLGDRGSLYVDILAHYDQRIGDPFLVLTYGDQRYYLEVWDESKFEAAQRA